MTTALRELKQINTNEEKIKKETEDLINFLNHDVKEVEFELKASATDIWKLINIIGDFSHVHQY